MASKLEPSADTVTWISDNLVVTRANFSGALECREWQLDGMMHGNITVSHRETYSGARALCKVREDGVW